MLFEEERQEKKRPKLPPGTPINYKIGFLFNFTSGKSTRFDLEPLVILDVKGIADYKRISMQVDKGLAYLQPLDDAFYKDVVEFSDNQLLNWMTATGNRFIRNHSGTWAHVSARELVNLRKHYITLLHNLWPRLSAWPDVFILQTKRFDSYSP